MDRKIEKTIVILVSIFITMNLLVFLFKPDIDYMFVKLKNMNFKGVINKKFNDKKKHDAEVIQLNTNGKIYSLKYEIFHRLEIGDSLYKKKGNMMVKVYKQNKLSNEFNLYESINH